jgi:acetolactate synthase I/III small subunit
LAEQRRQLLELLVNNHPGVMVHVAGLFARRAFNLEGIWCGPLADGSRSRMLLLLAEHRPLDQVIHQLEKLQDVVSVKAWPDARQELFEVPGYRGD